MPTQKPALFIKQLCMSKNSALPKLGSNPDVLQQVMDKYTVIHLNDGPLFIPKKKWDIRPQGVMKET